MDGVVIYKSVFDKLCYTKNTNSSKLAIDLGLSRSYFAAAFSGTDGKKRFPKTTAYAVCQALDCTIEELTKCPVLEPVQKPEVPPEVIDVIREGFRMIHGDIQELIKLWKPETEKIKIGGDASK